jgi:hypothetical protein
VGSKAGFLHTERDGQAVAAGGFVAEDLQQEIVMRHLLLAREREPLGERVEHARQLQPPQDGFEIRTDHVGRRHEDSSPSEAARASGSLYWVVGRR